MVRRVWTGLGSFMVCASLFACSDASPSAPPGSGEAPPESSSGAGGSNTTPAASGNGGAVGEPNTGLDGAPVAGNGAGGTLGAGSMNAGGTAPTGEMAMGGSSSVGEPTGSPFPAGVTRPRLLIIGDSISAGPGCYKKYLLAALNAAGFNSFDFVGEYTDDCGGGVMHGARSCSTAQQYTQPSFTLQEACGAGPWPGLSALAAEHRPDLVMIQLGVNDVWGGMAAAPILASYTTLVEQARAQNPNVVLVVAQIQKIRPMDAGGDATFARAQQLIEAVPAWAAAQSQAQSPVFVADLWTSSDVAQTLDGVHPDDAGAQRMGQSWFEALRRILPGG